MLVSQPATAGVSGDFGDLFRSGPVAAFPASPAPLNGFIGPAAMDQDTLNSLTSTFAGLTIDLSSTLNSTVFWAVVGLSAGWICPGTLTASNASLLLGTDGSLTLTVRGTLEAQHFFTPWTDTYPWAFTELLTVTPSGDPVDTGNILTVNSASPAFSMPGFLGSIVKPFAPLVAGGVTPLIQAMINQAIPPAVSAFLIANDEVMTPTAVISFNKTTFEAATAANPATITFVLSVADIFGPGTTVVNTTVVPDVIDDNARDAARALSAAQLKSHFNTREPGFVVTGQDPQSGTRVVVGSMVEVTMGPPNLGD
jgi:hypothetical protein